MLIAFSMSENGAFHVFEHKWIRVMLLVKRPDSNLYLHYKSNLLNFEGAWFFLMSDNSILPTTHWRIDDGLVE